MNPLVIFVAVLGVVSAQTWGNQGYQGGSRAPIVPAPLSHDGRVLDTPEINQAKAAHFAAHEAAQRAAPRQSFNNYQAPRNYDDRQQSQQYKQQPQQYLQQPIQDYDNYDDGSYRQNADTKEEPRWRGPLAKVEFTSDGKFIKDTPEVAHAKSAHFAAIQAAQKNGGGKSVGYEGNYQGQHDDGSYRGEGEQHGQYNSGNQGGSRYQGNGGFQGGNQYNSVDDGQYRGDSSQQNRNYQGQGQARQQNRFY